MASINYLLNRSDDSPDFLHCEPATRRKIDNAADDTSSEIPVLADQTWECIWGQVLQLNPGDDVEQLPSSKNEDMNSLCYNVQEGIEQWASHDLPPAKSLSRGPELISTTAISKELVENAEHLCYGMIYRTSVKLVGDMSGIDRSLHANSGTQTFHIGKPSPQLTLTFPNGKELGLLNSHITEALATLIERPSIQLEAMANVLSLRETIGKVTKAKDAIVRVNIHVYGSREARAEVGRHLSDKKVYLQRPDGQRPGSIYDNPHVIKFPDLQILDIGCEPGEFRNGVSHSNKDSREDFQKTIQDVYASLHRGSHLRRLKGDSRLKTTLLPHQQEGLDFMTQREKGPIPPEFRLWHADESDSSECYIHSVTREKSRIEQVETGGGILADEMGMGKSLSILSLIVRTLEDAHNWACDWSTPSLDTTTSEKCFSRATLVIVPSALLINGWLEEVGKHVGETLKVIKYHGKTRIKDSTNLRDSDIILTTYHTLTEEFKRNSSPLHDITWFRIVLDEAHIIRRPSTRFHQTVCALDAKSRWCLTGTPIQNRLEDIGALFAFIRVPPFHHLATFRRFIVQPFDESEERRIVASKRLSTLIDSICLRRTTELLELPEPKSRIVSVEFTEDERQQYEQTKKTMTRAIRQQAGDEKTHNVFGMFQAQLQLRILCNHGTFQHLFSWATARRSYLEEREDAICAIGKDLEIRCSTCRESMPILSSKNMDGRDSRTCAHILCSECWNDSSQDGENRGRESNFQCPLCIPTRRDGAENKDDGNYSGRNLSKDDYFAPEGHSSKMAALIADVQKDLWETKSIIFSCWTRTLDLIAKYLEWTSIPFTRIDGECTLPRRQKILDDFARNTGTPVLIMTTGTGAFGLNLTSANRVFIVEPQWNPSVENQAVARAIRLGQGRSVLVTRYVVNRTVEIEMRSQQNRKLKIAEIGWALINYYLNGLTRLKKYAHLVVVIW